MLITYYLVEKSLLMEILRCIFLSDKVPTNRSETIKGLRNNPFNLFFFHLICDKFSDQKTVRTQVLYEEQSNFIEHYLYELATD